MNRLRSLLVVTLPPLALAAIGVFHPHHLNGDTAPAWTVLHIALLPLFPLLAVVIWQLVRGIGGVVAWFARIAALLFIPLYTALDAIAGIATGTLVMASGKRDGADVAGLDELFATANALGNIGAYALVAAGALATAAVGLRRPRWGLFAAGGLLLLAGLVVFAERHIYFPLGVLSLIAIAAGAGLLLISPRAERSQPAERTIAP